MNEDKKCATCGKEYRSEADFLAGTSRWRRCQQEHLWFNCSCGSTMMVKKGKYSWYSPEKFMSEEARGVFNTLGALKDLPHLPTSIMQLQQAMLKPDATPKEVAALLRHEPILAAQILQLAENIRNTRNSANPKIKALEHALVYVGFKPLSDLVMTAALRNMPIPGGSPFDIDKFWNENYLIGMIAEHIVHRYRLPLTADEVFLAGSLCNLGKLVTAFCFAPLIAKIERAVTDPSMACTWRRAEKMFSFPDHCILGEIASMLWGFPEYIMKANRQHHEVPKLAPRDPALTLNELVAFANQMAHWVLLQPHRMEYEIVTGFEKKLGISESDVEKLARDLGALKRQVDSDPKFAH